MNDECPDCGGNWPNDVYECPECGLSCDDLYDADEYDGQPDEYTEWQDLYGGDDYCYGSYGEY